MKNSTLLLSLLIISSALIAQENTSPTWRDFATKRNGGDLGINTVSDFSYAGYKYSNESIPSTSGWNTINVRDFGAIPGDSNFDDKGIQDAIDAAENSGSPTVILFESGRYRINEFGKDFRSIIISKNNVVLRGTGSGNGGTEIFSARPRLNGKRNVDDDDPYNDFALFIGPVIQKDARITGIQNEMKRGSFEVTVGSNSGLTVGQRIFIHHSDKNNLDDNGVSYPSTPTTDEWTNLNTNGIEVREAHVIKKIEGNKITFENPIYLNIPSDPAKNQLRVGDGVENVGLEDIRFTGNWPSYDENFIHHKPMDDTHDQGWRGVLFERVFNCWIRDCEFKDWNEAGQIKNSTAITIERVKLTGKRAHHTFFSTRGTNNLFKDMVDEKNDHHGLGFQSASCGNVILNHKLNPDQRTDLHGKNPYANLFDNVEGGILRDNGGAHRNHPNAGPYNTFWNFEHNDVSENNFEYNFWTLTSRKNWTYANPVFVGFTSPGDNVKLVNTGKNESQGTKVYPLSLYYAQLQLRKYGGFMSASNSKLGVKALRANDDKSSTFWTTGTGVANNWIMLDFGTPRTLNKIFVDERTSSIGDYRLEYWNESSNNWVNLKTGNGIGAKRTLTFASTTFTTIRLYVENKKSGSTNSGIEINTFGIGEILGVNQLPTVALTSPAEGEVFELGTDIKMVANANDSDGTIQKVNFKVDDAFYKQATELPYEETFTPSSIGTYKLGARAFDNVDGQTEASPVNITVVKQEPYANSPLQIPGVLQAENYDEGAQNISYNDNDPENKGASESNFRVNEGVDVGIGNGGNIVGWTVKDEWLEYTIDVNETVNYDMLLHYSSANGGGQLNMTVDGNLIKSISIPTTGSWDVYNTLNDQVALTQGEQILRLSIVVKGFNIDKIEFTKAVVSSTENQSTTTSFEVFPNPSEDGVFQLSHEAEWEVMDLDGKVILSGSTKKINLTNHASGIYLLKSNGKVLKLVKE